MMYNTYTWERHFLSKLDQVGTKLLNMRFRLGHAILNFPMLNGLIYCSRKKKMIRNMTLTMSYYKNEQTHNTNGEAGRIGEKGFELKPIQLGSKILNYYRDNQNHWKKKGFGMLYAITLYHWLPTNLIYSALLTKKIIRLIWPVWDVKHDPFN